MGLSGVQGYEGLHQNNTFLLVRVLSNLIRHKPTQFIELTQLQHKAYKLSMQWEKKGCDKNSYSVFYLLLD